MDSTANILYYILVLPAIIIGITVHEFAHAFVANKLGDPTPKLQGRLSLNPLKHLDPVGAISLLLFRFGWGKPVQVNPQFFERPTVDNALVSAAGPISNLLLIVLIAIPSRILLLLLPSGVDSFELIKSIVLIVGIPFVTVNAALMLFNLIPIPPLDGSRIVKLLIPEKYQYLWENLDTYGFIILIALFILPFSPFSSILGNVLNVGISAFLNISFGV